MKLSEKQYSILEVIRIKGSYPVDNAQNPTIKKLIQLGLCNWNEAYNALIFTKKGQEFEL